jgi:cell shape-determining protein MreC
MELIIILIVLLVFLALVLMFIFSPGGPQSIISSITQFLNSSTEYVTSK